MAARNTSGTQVCITKTTATPTSVTHTGITGAAPPVVSVASTTGMKEGDLVSVSGTGNADLDGKLFIVKTIVSNALFALAGADTTVSGAVATGNVLPHPLKRASA